MQIIVYVITCVGPILSSTKNPEESSAYWSAVLATGLSPWRMGSLIAFFQEMHLRR